MSFTVTLFGKQTKVKFLVSKYRNKATSVVLMEEADGTPLGTLSVNLPGSENLPEGVFYDPRVAVKPSALAEGYKATSCK